MTRDEIYDHLAQVYIGKKSKHEKEKKKQFNAWLLINIVITLVIFASAFYGFTAFLAHKKDFFNNKVIYSLNKGPLRINYDLTYPYPPVKTFSLTTPQINAGKYRSLQFTVRGLEDGYPGIVRVEIRNRLNESSSVFIDGIKLGWKHVDVPFDEFNQITDWTGITEVSFILESWNAERQRGIILIDEICFSS
ncbi:MAG TPA: hypothetical protein PLT76_08870 [Candidatus Omnitrophota bacterium]|nr:hypothetical protein [Candidatus Omnitrophota bacterium]HQO58815.1 hypothetical protein [Candidatus Omnitrophota bacterium]